MKASYIKSKCWIISTKLLKFLFIRELKHEIHHSHKRTLWDRGAWIKIQKESHAGGLIWKGDKSPRAEKSAKMAWECRTNEYSYSPYATIMWCLSCQLPEDKINNETHLSASAELSGLGNLGFPLSQIGLSSMIKGTHLCRLRNPDSWKNSIEAFIVRQSATQRIIAQRSRFTR